MTHLTVVLLAISIVLCLDPIEDKKRISFVVDGLLIRGVGILFLFATIIIAFIARNENA